MYEISQEGPTKLCPSCCRFMRIDKQRRLLPHKKFLSNIDCPGENTSNQALLVDKKHRESLNQKYNQRINTDGEDQCTCGTFSSRKFCPVHGYVDNKQHQKS